ncbi:MAG: ATP-binding protein [Acidobacteria bacterium]|nr:ATP-binding protein [Acidobacteriota bacterium]
MRIESIKAKDALPVKRFEVERLSDVIVLAGANGVGKTRLMQAIVSAFQQPNPSNPVQLCIQATSPAERTDWGKATLDTSDQLDCDLLAKSLHKSRQRTRWHGSVIHFESDRTIQRIAPYSFSWDIVDPWEESIGWNLTFAGLKARFQDTLHSIFRKVQSRRDKIARRAEELMRSGANTMTLDFPDPTLPFKEAFSQLVAPKKLLDADPKSQNLLYELDGQQFDINTLSSGEREVVNVVFDFILRNPADCIVLFDEPELHLHPELSYKLLQTLRTVGTRNQFVFCTHSPDIITASLDQSVIFISPPRSDNGNQAVCVKEEDQTNQALRLLGQSIGIVALGKRIVLIEGSNASLDKQVYGQILRALHPGLVLVPCGGKDTIRSFSHLVSTVLDRTIWGVDFFMLCDHDAAVAEGGAIGKPGFQQRLRLLPRYHLENYFLDPNLLAACFASMVPEDSWLGSPEAVERRLQELATETLPYAVGLIVANEVRRGVGSIDIMPSGLVGQGLEDLSALFSRRVEEERTRTQANLEPDVVTRRVAQVYQDLLRAVSTKDPEWKVRLPGRPIFNRFAAAADIDPGRLKLLYLSEAKKQDFAVFTDILEIFSAFAEAPPA